MTDVRDNRWIAITKDQALEALRDQKANPITGKWALVEIMAANYDSNGEEGEYDGLTTDDLDTRDEVLADSLVDGEANKVDLFDGWGPFTALIEVPEAYKALGITVLLPQDLSWGTCPGAQDEGGPHVVSLSLCSGCLEYDPE